MYKIYIDGTYYKSAKYKKKALKIIKGLESSGFSNIMYGRVEKIINPFSYRSYKYYNINNLNSKLRKYSDFLYYDNFIKFVEYLVNKKYKLGLYYSWSTETINIFFKKQYITGLIKTSRILTIDELFIKNECLIKVLNGHKFLLC